MNAPVSPPAAAGPLLPESAPFTAEQRAWLNGFFAGIFTPNIVETPAGVGDAASNDDDAPWHDPALPIDERLKLADGKPLRRRMMAAMAQQDCGQCGYLCETYANAIVNGSEARLNLCVPGEKPTARMLKTLAGELAAPPTASEPKVAPVAAAPASIATPVATGAGYSRAAPVEVTFVSRRRLNKADSEKATYHIEFDISGSSLDYAVGDSFGVFPANDPTLVDVVIAAIDAPADFPIAGRTLRDVLLHDMALGSAPDALFALISYMVGGERKEKARLLAKGEDPDGDAATLDVLAAFEKFPGIRPDPEALVESLEPLQPRLYSISSSPKAHPGRLSLTVDHVRYLVGERVRRGIASSWLDEHLPPGTRLKAYIQRAHNFALPASGDTPIIMVGPGTGVAPFRAFLQERVARSDTGSAWLFFGHQRRAADFFYEEEMAAFQARGALTHLSLAWSRDSEVKVYVQDKMRDEGAEFWAWLERGAHFYVCGDATRMASDVERAVAHIIMRHGNRDDTAAKAYVRTLKQAGRYQADVY